MKKSKKTAEFEKAFPGAVIDLTESMEALDQEKLQLMDELNEEWVQKWRTEVETDRKQKLKNTGMPHAKKHSNVRQ